MYSIKESVPEAGTPVVYVAVEKDTGHTNAGLGQWSEDLEAQLLDASLDSFWATAYDPFIARLGGAVRSLTQRLTDAEMDVHDLDEQLEELVDLKEEFEQDVLAKSFASTIKD